MLSVVRCWWVFAVCSLLPIGVCRRFGLKCVDCCLLFVVRGLLIAPRPLFVVCCSLWLFVVCWLRFVVVCWLRFVVDCCSLSGLYCCLLLMFVRCCVRFVVRWRSLVVACLLVVCCCASSCVVRCVPFVVGGFLVFGVAFLLRFVGCCVLAVDVFCLSLCVVCCCVLLVVRRLTTVV